LINGWDLRRVGSGLLDRIGDKRVIWIGLGDWAKDLGLVWSEINPNFGPDFKNRKLRENYLIKIIK